MSQDDASRLVAAAHRVRAREGPGFSIALLARPTGMSRATLYRRLAADPGLAAEVERIRSEGALSPREAFLRATTALLAEKGLSALTMEAVAERAGFSTATLYRCFRDRDGLVREALRGSMSAAPARAALLSEGPLEEVLVRFVEVMLTRLREQPHLLRFLMFGDAEEVRELRRLRRDEERLSMALLTVFERHRARLRPVRPQELAAGLMGHVITNLVLQRAFDGGGPPDARTIVTLFLRGARRPGGERSER